MGAGEERGAPAPYSFVSRVVRVQHAAVDPDSGVPTEWWGTLEDVSTLGAEVVAGGERHFVPWSNVARMSLEEDGEPGG